MFLQAAILYSSIAIYSPAQADPLGQLVNMIMNHVLDQRETEAERARQGVVKPNRAMPGEARTGIMSPPIGNQVEIDGDDYQLAFNSRIRDENNRIVQTTMIQEKKRVRYVLNAQEQVEKIWLLTPNEK